MHLLKIQDDRDNLEKARRKELENFAREQGVTEIQPTMPARLMRRILRQKGLVDITIPSRPLGHIPGAPDTIANPPDSGNAVEAMADDDLMRQWAATSGEQAVAPQEKPAPGSGLAEMTRLRKECKRLGIKMSRTDTMIDLKAKLDGQDPA